MKHVESVVGSADEVTLVFSNQITDLIVEIKNPDKYKQAYFFRFVINEKYHDDSKPQKKKEIDSLTRDHFDEMYMGRYLDKAKGIADWYFDLAMKYGKPKIYCDWTGNYEDRKICVDIGSFNVFSGKNYIN